MKDERVKGREQEKKRKEKCEGAIEFFEVMKGCHLLEFWTNNCWKTLVSVKLGVQFNPW